MGTNFVSPANPEEFIDECIDVGRHSSTIHMLAMLQPNPNLRQPQINIAQQFWQTAKDMVTNLMDTPELTAGLRKLLEAKDCFIRASLDLDPESYTDR